MVSGLSETAKSNLEAEEFFVPEFGQVSLDWFDLSKKYRGSIFKLNSETARFCSEIAGFNANYELSGIKTAYIDFFKSHAYCVLEIEKNTKPTDLAVRYSRERWSLLESASKNSENLRPWIKSEYKSGFISEKVKAALAEQLKFSSENAEHFIIRLNFKDKIFGLIAEESYLEKMPTGGFSGFALPTESMLAFAEKYGLLGEKSLPQKPAQEAKQEEAKQEEARQEITKQENTIQENTIKDDAVQEEALKEETKDSREARSPIEQAGSAQLKNDAKQRDDSAAEKLIQTKQESSDTPDKRSEERVESSSAKYATYSRSEVDHMLKQQAENIASALGSKISAQQRVFQEACERQEKAFSKLSDGFTAQFDQSRQRLESMSKESETTIHSELDTFKRELSKELEQYRAQLNKNIIPVAKFIEEKNTRPPEKAQEKQQKEPAAKAAPQSSADVYALKPLLIVNLVIGLLILGALFVVVMPDIARIQDLEKQVNKLNSKLSAQSASSSGTGNSVGGIDETNKTVPASGAN